MMRGYKRQKEGRYGRKTSWNKCSNYGDKYEHLLLNIVQLHSTWKHVSLFNGSVAASVNPYKTTSLWPQACDDIYWPSAKDKQTEEQQQEQWWEEKKYGQKDDGLHTDPGIKILCSNGEDKQDLGRTIRYEGWKETKTLWGTMTSKNLKSIYGNLWFSSKVARHSFLHTLIVSVFYDLIQNHHYLKCDVPEAGNPYQSMIHQQISQSPAHPPHWLTPAQWQHSDSKSTSASLYNKETNISSDDWVKISLYCW